VTTDELALRLDHLKQEHGELDVALSAMIALGTPDQIAAARIKKRKLQLKDDMARIETMLIPDIIA